MRSGYFSGRSSPPKVLAILAACLVVGALAIFLLPVYLGYRTKAECVEALQNMKQLHFAIQQMTLDNQTTGDGPIRWTCSGTTPLTLEQLTNALVGGGYADSAQLKKQLVIRKDHTLGRGVEVLAVTASDPANTLLLATDDWKMLFHPELIEAGRAKKFVVFRKDGDGALFFHPKPSMRINHIGSGGMHNYLPLK